MADEVKSTEQSAVSANGAKSNSHKRVKKAKAPDQKRTRVHRPYPQASFEESLTLAEAIYRLAGDKVRRLTLFKNLDRSPTSSASQMLITNSTKYGLTKGSFVAEWLELTELGKRAVATEGSPRDRLEARFKLAIEGVAPFNHLYSTYKGKRLPTHDVLQDALVEAGIDLDAPKEAIDNFVVNANYLGLLQNIAGAETLIPVEQVIEETPGERRAAPISNVTGAAAVSSVVTKWDKICFFIAPIGEEGSEARRHSDLFLGHLIEPALKDFGLDVVRADMIGEGGMITTQIIEHILRSRLAIVDLSHHNPNAFYEMALRHASKLPVVQIIRKQDRLPFDVNQVRTVVIDTTDIYTLIPRLETYRSEIATQVRAVLDGNTAGNPLSVFFPGFEVTIPKESSR